MPNTNSTGAKTIIDPRKLTIQGLESVGETCWQDWGEAGRWIFAIPVKIRVERGGFSFSADKWL